MPPPPNPNANPKQGAIFLEGNIQDTVETRVLLKVLRRRLNNSLLSHRTISLER